MKNTVFEICTVKPTRYLCLRNNELVMLIVISMIAVSLMLVTLIGLLAFFVILSIFFTIGFKRATFLKSEINYKINSKYVEMYVDNKLYKSLNYRDCNIYIESATFGTCLVFKPKLQNFFETDSLIGFPHDLGKRSYEFIVYGIKDPDKVIEFIDNHIGPENV